VLAVRLSVTGMHCGNCSGKVEKTLSALPGVRRAAVALTTEQALVEIGLPSGTAPEALAAAVQALGFGAAVLSVDRKGAPVRAKEATAGSAGAGAREASAKRVVKVVLRVGGMHCGNCSGAVERALKRVPG
jgi:P-type Cu+ transporter